MLLYRCGIGLAGLLVGFLPGEEPQAFAFGGAPGLRLGGGGLRATYACERRTEAIRSRERTTGSIAPRPLRRAEAPPAGATNGYRQQAPQSRRTALERGGTGRGEKPTSSSSSMISIVFRVGWRSSRDARYTLGSRLPLQMHSTVFSGWLAGKASLPELRRTARGCGRQCVPAEARHHARRMNV